MIEKAIGQKDIRELDRGLTKVIGLEASGEVGQSVLGIGEVAGVDPGLVEGREGFDGSRELGRVDQTLPMRLGEGRVLGGQCFAGERSAGRNGLGGILTGASLRRRQLEELAQQSGGVTHQPGVAKVATIGITDDLMTDQAEPIAKVLEVLGKGGQCFVFEGRKLVGLGKGREFLQSVGEMSQRLARMEAWSASPIDSAPRFEVVTASSSMTQTVIEQTYDYKEFLFDSKGNLAPMAPVDTQVPQVSQASVSTTVSRLRSDDPQQPKPATDARR